MQYMGGKSKIAQKIAAIVNAERGSRPLVEPFCGGLSVTAALGGRNAVAADAHPGLITLYKGMQLKQFDPPSEVSEHDYQAAKSLPDDSPLKAFIGFGCSFGAKWFGGYARGAGTYAKSSRNSLWKKILACREVVFMCSDYKHLWIPQDAVIYADPPYGGTTNYSRRVTGEWDKDTFVKQVQRWALEGAVVFVSEYNMPIGKIVWEREQITTLQSGLVGRGKSALERLYRIDASDGS